MRRVSAAILTAAALLLAVAGGPTGAPAGAVPPGTVPGNDWLVESPASHGMDPGTLDLARQYAFADGRNTQGVVVVHDGVIVAEWYAPGNGPDSWAASWSVAKSFASALIGIAIDDGLIPNIDVPMTTYYPAWIGTSLEGITLRHVLQMETGREWDEDYNPASLQSSDIINMVALQPDQLAFAADRPVIAPPGTSFNYSSGDSMLLSGVIEQATGMSAEAYARQELLGPIGIDQLDWWQDAAGHTLTYCCVDTTSRDFARFGLLYLRGGDWGGTQVVPASWVSDSVTDTAASFGGYGYQWWVRSGGTGSVPPYFSAVGHDGQYIHVIPSLDLVVVRNGYYGKSPCPAVADPNLLYHYPPQGLVPGQGTVAPNSWSDRSFLEPIVASFGAPPVEAFAPEDPTVWPADTPTVEPYPCPVNDPAPSPPAAVVPGATVAPTAVVVTPAFTG